MQRFAAIVKYWLIPGSMTFLLVGLALGVVLLNAGPIATVAARAWLTSLLAAYFLLSLPIVANLLIAHLHRDFASIRLPRDAAGARVLVAFGNGSVHYAAGALTADMLTRRSYFCVFEAARLFRLLELDWVIASGGGASQDPNARSESDLMREELVRLEVPIDRILLESASRTTGEQVASVARLLDERGLIPPVIVVTTGAHMRRVMKLCRQRQLGAIPSVTPGLRYDEGRTGWRRWWPSLAALTGSHSALYEYLAVIYSRPRVEKP